MIQVSLVIEESLIVYTQMKILDTWRDGRHRLFLRP